MCACACVTEKHTERETESLKTDKQTACNDISSSFYPHISKSSPSSYPLVSISICLHQTPYACLPLPAPVAPPCVSLLLSFESFSLKECLFKPISHVPLMAVIALSSKTFFPWKPDIKHPVSDRDQTLCYCCCCAFVIVCCGSTRNYIQGLPYECLR